jgi:hypothetical protein
MANPDSIIADIRDRFNKKWIIAPNASCHMWTAAHSGDYGVMKVQWPGCKKKLGYAHRISFILSHLNAFPTYNPVNNISHLCHNPLCVNPEHLSHEPYTVNARRKNCHDSGRCSNNHIENHIFDRHCIFVQHNHAA